MIYEVHTPSQKNTVLPHWGVVPFLKGKKSIEFKPGLNIVFGPNGSGKSTIITTLAKLLHCHQGGFQKVTETSVRPLFETKLFARDDESQKDFLIKQTVLHDGDECRYVGAEQDIGISGDRSIDGDFGMAQLSMMFGKKESSSGQFSFMKFNRVFQTKPREGSIDHAYGWGPNTQTVNSFWKNRLDWCYQVLAGKKREGHASQMVIITDEPDRSMDLENQQRLWNFLRAINSTGTIQIIVASHSVFAMGLPEANYIETVDGAQDKLLACLHKAGFTRGEVPPAASYADFMKAEKERAEAMKVEEAPAKTTPRRSRARRPARAT